MVAKGEKNPHSKEWCEKVSKALKGKPHTPEWNERISQAHKKNRRVGWHHTEEARAKIGEASRIQHLGKPMPEETKRKLSEALTGQPGRKHTPEACKKISIALTGRPLSLEHRAKISKIVKGRKYSKETLIKRSCAMQGIPIEEFNGFVAYGDYCEKFNNEFKERVRRFFDRKCGLCGKPESENKKRLGVHHVQYDKRACCDGKTNWLFVPLCQACHGKTTYNREYWKQYFTEMIYLQYGGRCYFPKQAQIIA